MGTLLAQNAAAQQAFPDTTVLIQHVAEHQKNLENLLTLYTFTEKTTVYTLDKAGKVKSQHTDTYYVTPTKYEVFVLHIARDGKPVSDGDLQKQQKEIEHKIQQYEKKEQKTGEVKPKESLLFADIILKSKFTPVRWEEHEGKRLMVYTFEPKEAVAKQGDLMDRIAGDMKGKMWISADDEEVVRMEFTGVSELSLGWGLMGNVKGFEGYVEQKRIRGEAWLPSHEEFVANGRQFVSGFRMRQVSEYSDYLKASTDVFQQIHAPKGVE
jgi:hypothetical protein